MRQFGAILPVAAVAAAALLQGCVPQPTPTATLPAASSRSAYDPKLAHELLAFHQERVQRDPQGAIGWVQLSGAYLKLARESDSNDLAKQAEEAARKSLALRSRRNARAATTLADTLLEQHRFADALEASKVALRLEPENKSARRQNAEILLELGDYEAAKKQISDLPYLKDDPTGQALLARWDELHGKPESAQAWLQQAVRTMEGNLSASAESVSWFHQKLGDLQARLGSPKDAQESYERAIQLYPRSYKAMASMTRLAAAEGRWNDVLTWGARTGEVAQMTDIYGLMGDAMMQLGDTKGAASQYAKVDRLNQKSIDVFNYEKAHGHESTFTVPKHTHDRLYAEFLADHGRNLPLALHSAGDDLELRHDIHAYETAAWVRFKAGSTRGLQELLAKALATGDREPKTMFHAGMIHAALGMSGLAERELAIAVSTPGTLLPQEVEEAKAALGKLTRQKLRM